ncbi:hypothetical protein PSAB6_430036 [Paraburkholderia sabiae]|nr:hypothetical protein PSAB6_430036 [Paraburkholderia sabiae]
MHECASTRTTEVRPYRSLPANLPFALDPVSKIDAHKVGHLTDTAVPCAVRSFVPARSTHP